MAQEAPPAPGPPGRSPNPNSHQPDAKIPGLAIASLILGLVPVVPFVGSILAIVFGSVARSQINAATGRLRGMAMAVWGIFLGILTLAGTVILIAVLTVDAIDTHSANPDTTNFIQGRVSTSTTNPQYWDAFIIGQEHRSEPLAQACGWMSTNPATPGYNGTASTGGAFAYRGCVAGWESRS